MDRRTAVRLFILAALSTSSYSIANGAYSQKRAKLKINKDKSLTRPDTIELHAPVGGPMKEWFFQLDSSLETVVFRWGEKEKRYSVKELFDAL